MTRDWREKWTKDQLIKKPLNPNWKLRKKIDDC